jgi:predicted RNA binding protein YcfA (HicA-like mRNA interferase family)
MKKFPVDAPNRKIINALETLGFRAVREKEHISIIRESPDVSITPLAMHNHAKIKASTLRRICA